MMTEDKLQSECFQWMWNTYPNLRRSFWHVPNGGSRDAREGLKMKACGVIPGVHDLHFLHQGKFYTFELKVGRNTLSDDQKKFASKVEENGGHWFEIRDLESFKEKVIEIISQGFEAAKNIK